MGHQNRKSQQNLDYPIEIFPDLGPHPVRRVPMTYFLEYFRHSFGSYPTTAVLLLKGVGLVALSWVLVFLMYYAFYT